MKLWIRVFVVLAHVLVITAVLGPCRQPGCRVSMPTRGRAGAPAANPRDEPGETAEPDDGDRGSPRQQARPGPKEPAFTDAFFAPAIRPMADDLARETDICGSGVVVDWTHRRLLWGKREDEAVAVASLTKMMTVLLLMEALAEREDLNLQTQIRVTRSAAQVGGRQVWLDPRETFSIEDLLRCVLIHSANDAACQLAEVVAGSEDVFVTRMRKRAADLGLDSLVFHNSHGLPAGPTREENMGSAVQLAFLAGLLLQYDPVTEWSATRLSYLGPRIDGKKTQLLNTNKLVGRTPGVNGMKTGYTNKSGYCLAATCERAGREIIVVVTGCARGSQRDELVAKLVEWAFANP